MINLFIGNTVYPEPVGLPITTPTMAIEGGKYNNIIIGHNGIHNTSKENTVAHAFVVKLRQNGRDSYIVMVHIIRSFCDFKN